VNAAVAVTIFVPLGVFLTGTMATATAWLFRQFVAGLRTPINEIAGDVREVKDTIREVRNELDSRVTSLEAWKGFHLEVTHGGGLSRERHRTE
jgi:hypothetical protein